MAGDKLKTQENLKQINEWTESHKWSSLNKKSNALILNFTDNYQSTTQLDLIGKNNRPMDQMKILGTIVDNKLSWDANCSQIIRKVNARMQLIRGLQSFGATKEEMVHIWILFCRSVLEQSCVVWGTSISKENIEDLERTQKSFSKLILKEKYKDYENALILLNLESLETRRKEMCLKFAKSGIKNNTLQDLFPTNDKAHKMKTRNNNKYKVNFANTGRLKNASVITMQNILNEDAKLKT